MPLVVGSDEVNAGKENGVNRQPVFREERSRRQHQMSVVDTCGQDGFTSVVGGSAIPVDDRSAEFGRVLREPCISGAQHATNGPLIVIAVDADYDAGPMNDLCRSAGFVRQRR
jgi:hypothetical protein